MPANNPNSPDALVVQGPGPTGNEGYPIATVPAPGAAPTDVNIVAGGGGAVTIADGADVAEGATTDAAVIFDVAGTVSGKLRGIVKMLNAAWDATFALFRSGAHFYDATSASWKVIPSAKAGTGGNDNDMPITGVWVTNPGSASGFPLANAEISDGANPASWPHLRNVAAVLPYAVADDGSLGIRLRTPYVFNTVQAAAAGNTAAWTPPAGKKFRLMRYCVEVTGDASFAAPAVLTVTLNDNGTAMPFGHDIYIPAAAGIVPGVSYTSPWIDLGNGYLSVASNNPLNINLSAALATGTVRIIACGTEE